MRNAARSRTAIRLLRGKLGSASTASDASIGTSFTRFRVARVAATDWRFGRYAPEPRRHCGLVAGEARGTGQRITGGGASSALGSREIL